MFEATSIPRVFALPPGADFAAGLVAGFDARQAGIAPHLAARARIYLNTRRMHRRVRGLFEAGGARLLPRILTVAEIGATMPLPGVPPSAAPLARQLELTALVTALIEAEPGLAPKSAAFDLARSLAALIDEMAGEGVPFSAIEGLDTGGASRHWADSLKFLSIVHDFLAENTENAPSPEARQRRAVETLIAHWADEPPDHPILIAGSTGSRGTTAALMHAVARLEQGAVILPGFDFDLPDELWVQMLETADEDHPQYRFARFLADLGLSPRDVQPWQAGMAPAPLRNRLVSLALRPAPVTNQWLRDGPDLGDLIPACDGLSLIEAPSERHEAVAIALALREALAQGKNAALVTPDRMLTRRVAAELDRWGIEPDDSAGRPLSQSAPGRLLIHLARQCEGRMTTEALLVLLKHPLACRDGARGPHLRWARELELWLRRRNVAFPNPALLEDWATDQGVGAKAWAGWISTTLQAPPKIGVAPISTHLANTLATAEALCTGPDGGAAKALWEEPAGEAARRMTLDLTAAAKGGPPVPPAEFAAILKSILAREEVRDPVRPHPGVMIWGTLEARVQGADLLILGGLNEEVWPAAPAPDPWLNRAMRQAAGLLSPERQVGLAAHDFQQ
ncbi:MAG: double-strand break repair protein AddB, partial [Pseudomonadota bacterium]